MPYHIRRALPTDAPALTQICLLTGDAGASAVPLHSSAHQDLLARVYALPYVHPALAAHTFGFVLVAQPINASTEPAGDEAGGDGEAEDAGEKVVGYVLCARDTRAFEAAAEDSYWPAVRSTRPSPPDPLPANSPLTPADARMLRLIHATRSAAYIAHVGCIAFAPAHMHIDLLPEAQGRGFGRALVGRVVEQLESEGARGVWVGMDPRNEKARRFYEKVGFRSIGGAPDSCMGLRVEEWDKAKVKDVV